MLEKLRCIAKGRFLVVPQTSCRQSRGPRGAAPAIICKSTLAWWPVWLRPLSRCVFSGLLWLIICSGAVSAQVTTGTISGAITDEKDALLPGVSVTAKNLDTGITYTAVADDQGRYRVPTLALGDYEVRAELPGFQTAVRTGITLTVAREAIVDFTLKVGEITEKVVVTGEAPLVETRSSDISGVVGGHAIRELPLNGRDVAQLAQLEPGVIGVRRGEPGTGGGFGQKLSMGGARHTQTAFFLDGVSTQDAIKGTPGSAAGVMLGVDTIQEFRTSSSSYGVEYGLVSGGVMNAVTKSGTNEFHGTAFWFLRNDNLDARNFFDREKPEFKRNQFGATVGGPIIREKTFFLGAYEQLADRLGTTQIATVPSLALRQGILSGGRQVAIPALAKRFLDLYPLPNGRDLGRGRSEFISGQNTPTDEYFFQGRADHQISGRHSIFGRYTFDNATVDSLNSLGTVATPTRTRRQYLTVEEKAILSPSTLNVFRFGYNRSSAGELVEPVNEALWKNLVLDPKRVNFPVALDISDGTSGHVGRTLPRTFLLNYLSFSDEAVFVKGRHNVKIGGSATRFQRIKVATTEFGGAYFFETVEDLAQGRPFRYTAPGGGSVPERDWLSTIFAWYISDQVQIRPNLTVNAGLRHEFITTPVEANGQMSNLRFPLDATFTLGPLMRNSSRKNFAPRIGFAWDLFGNGKTALRSGFGMFFDQLLPWNREFHLNDIQPPYEARVVLENPPLVADIFNIAGPVGGLPGGFSAVGYDVTTPYSMQYNVSLERQWKGDLVVTLMYSGSQARHLTVSLEGNSAIPTILSSGQKFFPAGLPRRNPNFGSYRRTALWGNSNYNAFMFRSGKRYSGGLQFQSSYTWSKVLDDSSSLRGGEVGGNGRNLVDPDDVKRNRGPADHDVSHQWVFNVIYELPFGPGKSFGSDASGIAAMLIEGWQVGGIATLASGYAQTPTVGFDRSRSLIAGNVSSEVPNLRAGADNNPVTDDPNRFWNVDSFELQPVGFFGNLGKNTLRGPGYASLDLSVSKNFPVRSMSSESRLQFRFEAFNLVNRANFGIPSSRAFTRSGVDGTFGRISSTVAAARQLQFALKWMW